jgi:hypothetical protein
MASVSVTRELEQSADRVWQLISDFGNTSWMPAGTKCRVEGKGPGMIRHIDAGGTILRETLESLDPRRRTLVYTIPGVLPFPATDYRATMVVREKGTGSELVWSCTYEPVGDPAAAQTVMQGIYHTLAGWVADSLKSSS